MEHRINRRAFVAAAAAVASTAKAQARAGQGSDGARDAAAKLSARLQAFLWRSQNDDGSWRSETYGLLRSGQALTPFVLSALMDADPANIECNRATDAMDWIGKHLRNGCLGVADPDILEYPVYSTSLALRCCVERRDACREVEAMCDYLLDQQLTEKRGFDSNSLAYGGWGFGGLHPPGETGHMDLAHTRWALQALDARGESAETYGPKAARFLRLLQKHPQENREQPLGVDEMTRSPVFDGGFYFSPIVLQANKGRIERSLHRAYFRSYATATCDGVLALLAAGIDRQDERIRAAQGWLESHPSWEYPSGIPREHPEPWGDAVYFYHQAVRAEVYRRLCVGGDWPGDLTGRLSRSVRDDGSLANPNTLMKEDDPILCSTLALKAVSEASRHLDNANSNVSPRSALRG